MSSRSFLVLLAALLVGTAPPAPPEPSKADLVAAAQRADARVDGGAEAARRYGELLARFPEAPEANAWRYRLGVRLFEAGELARAGEQFQAVRAADPEGPPAQDAAIFLDWIDARLRETDPPPPPPLQPPPVNRTVRVRVVAEGDLVVLEGEAELAAHAEGRDWRAKVIEVAREGGKLRVREVGLLDGPLYIDAPGADRLAIAGRRFRGKAEVHLGRGKGVDVVNVLDVEDYLRGVLPKEVPVTIPQAIAVTLPTDWPKEWPREALRAQAVVSRSFALFHAGRKTARPWHMEATIMSQVYGGLDAEDPRADAAVAFTRGRFLAYKGGPAMATFHANSGGYTAANESIWEVPYPYLRAVEDLHSRFLAGYEWETLLTPAEIAEALNARGFAVPPPREVRPEGVGADGRAARVVLAYAGGETALSAHAFRMAVGSTRVRSTRFAVEPAEEGFRLKGYGYGHGVGLSQWGAYKLARDGRNYLEILNFFYEGLPVRRAWE